MGLQGHVQKKAGRCAHRGFLSVRKLAIYCNLLNDGLLLVGGLHDEDEKDCSCGKAEVRL